MFQQELQYMEGLTGQLHPHAGLAQFLGFEVDLEYSKLQNARRMKRRRHVANLERGGGILAWFAGFRIASPAHVTNTAYPFRISNFLWDQQSTAVILDLPSGAGESATEKG